MEVQNKINVNTYHNSDNLIDSKDLRNKNIKHIEVLEKVKEVLLLPKLEVMTTEQVSEYYEVPVETIKNVIMIIAQNLMKMVVIWKQVKIF